MSEYKSKKYTMIFSGVTICVFLFLSVLLFLDVSIESSVIDPSVIESITGYSEYIESYSSALLFWRISFYAALLLAFYLYGMGQKGRSHQGVVVWNMSRIGAYLILFELVIVQNILKVAFELILG